MELYKRGIEDETRKPKEMMDLKVFQIEGQMKR